MTTTMQESRILDALEAAQNTGLVEERVTVCGCVVVLRNLRPDEYEAILAESSDKKDASFLYAFQMGHICRAICEIGEVDLRGLEYIETTEGGKKITLERHDWLRSKVLSTWSREALAVLYRKFVDVLSKAESVSVEGVSFVVPDESSEDKFHRLLVELRALEEELPEDLVAHALESQGYRRKMEDARAGAERLDAMARAAPEPVAEPPGPVVEEPQPDVDPLDLIKRKPEQPRSRADQIAELESATANLASQALRPTTLDDEMILERPSPRLDAAGAATILDKPPVAGINPRYRPHGR